MLIYILPQQENQTDSSWERTKTGQKHKTTKVKI